MHACPTACGGGVEPGKECVKVLNEWEIRMLQDWLYMTHSEAKADRPESMGADPASTENKKGDGWDIEEDGRDILSYPKDSNLWIHGRIERLNDVFEKNQNVGKFLGNLRSLTSIITVDPKWEDIEDITKDLWLGKMNWREFVNSLRRFESF
ncbi:uncharacterized protein F5891DRAFT_988287 [Suillus fuscotomentosus]|uniref:Uncharacterized protein n=1 Tax=Suillus fuscotomentosus TaxID=1912939 RepID=A0AAD4DP71_9AGAM|nr:uncharacterized protein F5891DRAFT_988287 [Suillus fuscotomentosus]KAG1887443.1 hypothetical protein F5891DRAFT_988287 [Suillus fuscotomentosus]